MVSQEKPEAAETRETSKAELPLCVDLDGTLIKTDLLVESFFLLLKKNPFAALLAPLWLSKGKPVLKRELASRVEIDAPRLPYQKAVIDELMEQREKGRALVMCTASHRLLAEPVADHLGFFDEVMATDEDRNLKAKNKAAALEERFPDGFVYVGDTDADVPVWKGAAEAWLVASPSKEAKLRGQGVSFERVFHPEGRTLLRALIKALRPHQWAKNMLLFVPLILAHRIFEPPALLSTVLGFASFSILASSVYVLNDLLDVPADRHHHRKKTRPFAAGDLSLLTGLALFPVLLGVGLGLASFLPLEFFATVGIYYAVTLAYSLILKSLALVDVLVLAGLFTVRIIAGAAATDTPVSFWLFTFSMFVFLSLALLKRYVEVWTLKSEGRTVTIGRGYSTADLEQLQSLGAAAGYVSVLVLALYLNSPHVTDLYSQPTVLWAIVPLFMFWISRIWLQAGRGQVHDDPIVYALKDPSSWVVALLCAGAILGAK